MAVVTFDQGVALMSLIRKFTEFLVFSQLLDRGYLRLECIGFCTSLATVTASRFYLLLIPLVLPVYYWVPCTRYDIFGVVVDQDARHWPVYDHKAGGGICDRRKG